MTNAKTSPELSSNIYQGIVRHRRFSPKENHFNYRLYMLAIDVDELSQLSKVSKVLGTSWFNPIRIHEKDYLRGDLGDLKTRISDKVKHLGGNWQSGKITMLVQGRCFGLYFSPANFYFCYRDDGLCQYMLAEVSNTPWNERHYYLVDLQTSSAQVTDKAFHVSPFMDMAMQYYWKVVAPSNQQDKLLIHIENRKLTNGKSKLFDATLTLTKRGFTAQSLFGVWCSLPVMTLKIFAGIYYQAFKLMCKKVPFVPYIKGTK